MVKINPKSYASVFALPTDVADKHLRMAGKAQLKVLLWLYRNPAAAIDLAVISKDTGIPADEIDDAMLYWVNAGLLTNTDDKETTAEPSEPSASEKLRAQTTPETKTPEPEKQPERKNEKPPLVKPTIKDVAQRLSESDDIRSLFAEVQESFGRTIGYDVQANLLVLYDYYSLPAEVIVMLCNYAKTIGKQGSVAYIMKMGAAWAEQEINTFERAAEKIARMETADKIWSEFRRMTGIENPRPTAKQTEYLETWVSTYGFDTEMIALAYERAVEKKGSIHFGYMNGILRSWHESGYKTTEDVERAEREFAGQQEQKRTSAAKSTKHQQSPPSFDIELARQRSLALDPTKTKKGQ